MHIITTKSMNYLNKIWYGELQIYAEMLSDNSFLPISQVGSLVLVWIKGVSFFFQYSSLSEEFDC